jgi:chloride channel 3/4/5
MVLQTYQTRSLVFMLICCFIIRPRVILVEKLGSLVGLITVKDVLRFIAKEEAEGRHHGVIHPTSGVEGTLEEAWVWLTERVRPLLHR